MAKKSSFQLVNRGRKGKPCWTVEKDGQYVVSDRRKVVMEGYLRLMRDFEREQNSHTTGANP